MQKPPSHTDQEGRQELAHFTDGSKAQEKATTWHPLVLAPRLLPSGTLYPTPAPAAPLRSTMRVPVCRAERACVLSLLQRKPRVMEPLNAEPDLQHPGVSWRGALAPTLGKSAALPTSLHKPSYSSEDPARTQPCSQ